jgi:hypothetical protein
MGCPAVGVAAFVAAGVATSAAVGVAVASVLAMLSWGVGVAICGPQAAASSAARTNTIGNLILMNSVLSQS